MLGAGTLTRVGYIVAAFVAILLVQARPADAADKDYTGFKEVQVGKYGYKMMIPEQFELSGKIDKTSNWMFQPGSAETSSGKKAKTKKKKGFGIRIKGVGFNTSKTEETESSSEGGGGLEPALLIYVNWVYMPDVSSKTMFDTNIKSTRDDIKSPDPDYKDVEVFHNPENKPPIYDWEGLAYWFKEVDKPAAEKEEIHRWHIKAFDNKSAYTIGLTGTYEQFEKWGSLYEKTIKSFTLIPLEK